MEISQLTGAWEIESATITIGEETHSTLDNSRKMIKLITETHFAFFSKTKDRAAFASEQPDEQEELQAYRSFGAGGGKITLEGDQYTEVIEFCSHPNYEGQALTFKVSIQDGKLVQEGTYPLVELGLGEQDGYLVEVYCRTNP